MILSKPEDWIAQELVNLSTVPTAGPDGVLAPRHVDLRPFAVFGETIKIVPGGLTRVAMVEGSMIVNSSQGGGSKDTWVLEPHEDNPTSTDTAESRIVSPMMPNMRYGSEWHGQQQQQQQTAGGAQAQQQDAGGQHQQQSSTAPDAPTQGEVG